MKPLSSYLMLLVIFLLPVPNLAKAESVLIFSNGGGEGHGWLFGAAGTTGVECWLAFPLHVAGLDEDNANRPFEFQDKLGRRGQSGQPMGVAEVPEALEAMGGFDDLGFARVASCALNAPLWPKTAGCRYAICRSCLPASLLCPDTESAR